MRLTDHERQQIVAAARRHFGPGSRVILFGSRVDDTALGGDIDLMIDMPEDVPDPSQRRAAFLQDLWRRIGERRIDIVLRTPASEPETIHAVAETLGVPL